jgi:hypothetical protein
MSDPGFMIPLNQNDYFFEPQENPRDICSAQTQNTFTKAPWWTSENIRLTTNGAVTSAAVVGTSYVIQVGVQGLVGSEGDALAVIQHAQAWVCYPNSVAGHASANLVVPSMQNSQFASFSNLGPNAPIVFGSGDYQSVAEGAFDWISLSPWTPVQDDFLEQSVSGGHCCIIANVAGLSVANQTQTGFTGNAVGAVIPDNAALNGAINVCSNIYQAQSNIVIEPMPFHGRAPHGLAFLAGAPESLRPFETAVEATAINQRGRINPALRKALRGLPSAGRLFKPAASPPKALRLVPHKAASSGHLARILREGEIGAVETVEAREPKFGGGQRRKLRLPAHGLHALRAEIEIDPNDAPGTVHAIQITQTDANGARGGITAAFVVVP